MQKTGDCWKREIHILDVSFTPVENVQNLSHTLLKVRSDGAAAAAIFCHKLKVFTRCGCGTLYFYMMPLPLPHRMDLFCAESLLQPLPVTQYE